LDYIDNTFGKIETHSWSNSQDTFHAQQ